MGVEMTRMTSSIRLVTNRICRNIGRTTLAAHVLTDLPFYAPNDPEGGRGHFSAINR